MTGGIAMTAVRFAAAMTDATEMTGGMGVAVMTTADTGATIGIGRPAPAMTAIVTAAG
ncbi:hypothetical protein [Pseudorhizobium tarimense]|uniref:hypothetical protein n=1 Tax=Pseudorhizobium tarimense TaxID=1079109 RepID=UPI001FF3EDBF|nr:hypothetical protein [Pseudorhizobium tarimense]